MSSGLAPYLSLTVSQAAALPAPSSPEPSDHQTFTALLHHRAQYQASQLAVGFPQLEGRQCLSYTYEQLATLSLNLACQLRGLLQPQCKPDRQPIIAILGPSGPDFLLNVLACWQLGAAILPIALGTSASGAANLLTECQCDALLYSTTQADLVKQISSCGKYEESMVKVEWLFNKTPDEGFEANFKPLHDALPTDTLVIFHSSGSSGMPKPLPQLHSSWSTSLLTAPGRQFAAYTTTPLFHGGLSDLFRAFQASAPIIFFPWHLQVAPTIDNIIQSVKSCNQTIHYFLSVPFILEILIKDEEGSKMLQMMDLVSTGGAPLSESVGDLAVNEKNIRLVSRLGSSECGFLMSSFRDFDNDKQWSWLRVPDQLGQSWLHFEANTEGDKDVFELVVLPQWPNKQLSNRSDGSFATSDLYERHPRYDNRWRYKRRADDSIVMVNGKKVSGSMIEDKISASSLIEECIVFGANRPLLGAIVFASGEGRSSTTFRQEMKPFLHTLNRSLPSHNRIPMEMIHVGDSSLRQSLPRSSKGTLQKGLALDKLQGLIDDMYSRFEDGNAESVEGKKALSGQELKIWLKTLVDDICDDDISFDDDFYRAGIDSIMAARIRAGVHQGLDLQGFKLKSNDIYSHPNIVQLAQFIDSRGKQRDRERDTVMKDMINRYTKFSPAKAKDDSQASGGYTTVLLTGATGALGSHILYDLLEGSYKVDKVVCLVRAKDSLAARSRVKAALESRGLKVAADKKIDCITNLWELGLKKEVTSARNFFVIHSAWIVNFNLQLESFEQDCIAGLKDLLDLFLSCSNASRFIFCSSVASIMGGSSPHREVVSENSSDSGDTGYGNSKWVAEKICHSASSHGNKVVIARIGQLCGDTKKGIWNTSEAWPLMVRTAQEIGTLPDAGPDVDWLPVDVAARGIIDLCLNSKSGSRYFHVALPPAVKRPGWSDFVQWLRDSGLQFASVSKSDWLEAVKSKKDQIRGSALIDIWASIPESSTQGEVVEMEQAVKGSTSLAKSKAVDQELCKKMVESWKASGFLS